MRKGTKRMLWRMSALSIPLWIFRILPLVCLLIGGRSFAQESKLAVCRMLEPFLSPPPEFVDQFGKYKSLLHFENGRFVQNAEAWKERRQELKRLWEDAMGAWPPLIPKPKVTFLGETARENFTQNRIQLEVAADLFVDGYLLVPHGPGPFPAVFVPYYDPESSIGLGKVKLRDFGLELARRGYVTLSIGSPGSDARSAARVQQACQPLSFLAYVAANAANALANLPDVDPTRIGIVGHSYGGKWAMFSAALSERFACGVWSDPGIVFDESRPNVNYWEPWYLGKDATVSRTPGVPTEKNPRTGAYKKLFDSGRDLHEVMALIAPRPFLVSGGSEDPVERWQALNRVREVYSLLGRNNRVAMTIRSGHDPTEESNAQIYAFFDCFLK